MGTRFCDVNYDRPLEADGASPICVKSLFNQYGVHYMEHLHKAQNQSILRRTRCLIMFCTVCLNNEGILSKFRMKMVNYNPVALNLLMDPFD